MTWETAIYFIVIVFTLLLTGFLAWYAWKHPLIPGVRAFGIFALSECLITIAEILSMISATTEQAQFWFNVRFLFNAFIPVIFLIFAVRYYGHSAWLTRPKIILLCLIPLVTQFMVWTNPRYHLWVIRDVTFNRMDPFWIAEVGARIPGIWYIVHSFYSLALMLTGIAAILITAWQQRQKYLGQSILLFAGSIVGILATILPMFGLLKGVKYNIFIPFIGISTIFFGLAIMQFKFLTQSPVSDRPTNVSTLKKKDIQGISLFLIIFMIMISGIATIGYFSYKAYSIKVFDQVENQLKAVSSLKIKGLTYWRQERFNDAVALIKNPVFSGMIKDYLSEGYTPETALQLQRWLEEMQTTYGYSRVTFIDAEGRERISSPLSMIPYGEHLREEIAKALESGNVSWLDLHQYKNEPIHLSLIVPIMTGEANDVPLGVLVLDIDPEDWLYPYLAEWPGHSDTAETLLVRKDRDNVLFLNPLRFNPSAAVSLRIPLSRTDVLAVKAVRGAYGIVEGVDYRGHVNIGFVQSVPDSPWFLITRMDREEIERPLRERLNQIFVLMGALLISSGSVLMLVWQRNRERFYQEQYRIAEALRVSDEKFKKIFEISPDAASINRFEDGKFVSVNRTFENTLGYTREEVIGRSTAEIGLWVDRNEREKILAEIKEKGFVLDHEADFYTKDGQIVSGLLSATIIEIDGQPHMVFTSRDITQRKKIEKQLRESETRYRLIAENTADVIWVIDARTRQITYVSPSIVKLTGFTVEETMGRSIGNFVMPGSSLSFDELLKKRSAEFFERGSHPISFTDEVDQICKDGSVISTEMTTNYLTDENGQLEIIGVSRDIRQRKAAEREIRKYSEHLAEMVEERTRELRDAQEKLLRQERLAALGQLAGTIAHELRNPLGVITNAVTYLKMIQPDADQKVQEYLEIIRSETLTSEKIIAELLDFTRMKSAERSAVSISDIIDQALVRNPAPETVKVNIQIPKNLTPVYVNGPQIEQVIGNLLTNAYQAMPDGGNLSMRASASLMPGTKKNSIMLIVKDTGEGIAPENLGKIFEPLFTTRVKGIGLGLAISQKLIEVNHGKITVKSKPGIGSIFTLYLPVAEEKQ